MKNNLLNLLKSTLPVQSFPSRRVPANEKALAKGKKIPNTSKQMMLTGFAEESNGYKKQG